jgi:hypothetical protein
VTINAGRKNAIEVGQEYYVRRLQVDRLAPVTRDTPATIRTTGWIKVYAVDDEWSLVTVTHACDTIEVDDYLEPFKLPVVPYGVTGSSEARARQLRQGDRGLRPAYGLR